MPIHHAVRLSTVAVFSSALVAGGSFLLDGRAMPAIALVLGSTAAFGSHWAARRLQWFSEAQLVMLLRSVTLAVALDSGRRALTLLLVDRGLG